MSSVHFGAGILSYSDWYFCVYTCTTNMPIRQREGPFNITVMSHGNVCEDKVYILGSNSNLIVL